MEGPVMGVFWALSSRLAFVVLAISAILSAQNPAGPNAPTEAINPTTIDQTWQKANEAYDWERAEILKDVGRQAKSGPFRPEWQSLATYKVPVWYEDAKFGIFI